MQISNKPNSLINESSPYLLQHSYNLVNWYPWCNEALKKAEKENKPIFLSIGYSSCHWCHVMEKESFNNEEVANILNENFISIKVDREEHPEIDKFYQNVHIVFNNRSGGWPLSIFMTYDLKPFFAATYIPLEKKSVRYTFPEILRAISNQYNSDKSKLTKLGDEILKYVNLLYKIENKVKIDVNVIDFFLKQTEENYDIVYGGFSSAPKFPQTSLLDTLIYIYDKTKLNKPLKMVENTLKNMSMGGFYDLVDGGFCRYSTDNIWFVPHFEKMGYDNALLSQIYLDTYQITKNELYLEIALKTIEFMIKKMQKNGLFYSSSDADTDGIEGKYYTYEYDEILKIFKNYNIDPKALSVTKEGNFKGRNILRLSSDSDRRELVPLLNELKNLRKERKYPFIDEKIITSINSMMIKSLFKAAKINEKYYILAKDCLKSLLSFLYMDGILYHCGVYNKEIKIRSFLEDYAYLVDALIEAYQFTQEEEYLKLAIKFTRDANNFFDDFWYFSMGEFKTIADVFDESYPSSASLMIMNNIKLNNYVSGEFSDVIERSIKNYSGKISKYPQYTALAVKCILEWNLQNKNILKGREL
ncbi:hypothetical protein TDSAC_0930 [Thermodesulfobium acidiphilum]|uniref:Spermatogenesis-associated protein 20-like TRX domain-containing protein n=1 Tax=Thermodesulfobium acidiphilum TaxID=1794699 RepID=A0A2R4W0P3_THEAF|nr:thioredoxin domain-containing protein [Thermodesulfobium acidiphilum]AWB10284.1 hypothetical protein TDSAC_0930 [Thermodesulfobium acidiphilum]